MTKQTADQYNGKTKIRRVEILKVEGETATVKALNGPLAGSVYTTETANLKSH